MMTTTNLSIRQARLTLTSAEEGGQMQAHDKVRVFVRGREAYALDSGGRRVWEATLADSEQPVTKTQPKRWTLDLEDGTKAYVLKTCGCGS